uniref:Uncharacterized protein n=1 Tax=Craspedostauros australis TaxID=1486917 RepID=A0A7R9WW60_9STRA
MILLKRTCTGGCDATWSGLAWSGFTHSCVCTWSCACPSGIVSRDHVDDRSDSSIPPTLFCPFATSVYRIKHLGAGFFWIDSQTQDNLRPLSKVMSDLDGRKREDNSNRYLLVDRLHK